MFPAYFVAAALLAGLLPPTPTPGGMLIVGRAAPPLVLRGLDGALAEKSAEPGHALFVSVFSTRCAPCRAETAVIVAAYRRYRGRVTFVGIDEGEPAPDVAAYVKRLRMPYAVGIDRGQLASTYGASALPHSVFIDGRGIVRALRSGPLTKAQLDRQIAVIAPPWR